MSTEAVSIGSDPPFSSFPEGVAVSGICRVEPEEEGSRNFHMLGDGSKIPSSPYVVLIEEAWSALLDPSMVAKVASAYCLWLLLDFQLIRSSLARKK